MNTKQTIDFLRSNLRRAPVMTLILTLSLSAIYLSTISAVGADADLSATLSRWGNSYLKVLEGEPWRLVTYAFLHTSWPHLTFNLIALIILGVRLEQVIGPFSLLTLYLSSATLGGALSLYWRDLELSVGASGGVYGLFGAELVFVTLLRRPTALLGGRRFDLGFLISALWLTLGLTLGLTFSVSDLTYEPSLGLVDHATHLSGLVVGVVLGWALLGLKGYGVMLLSARGVFAALSPLFITALSLLALWLSHPTPPGFGGFLGRFIPQELAWRQAHEETNRLSVAEQQARWSALLPALSQAQREVQKHLAQAQAPSAEAPPSVLRYARQIERYLSYWVREIEQLARPPLEPLAPQISLIRARFDRARGQLAARLKRRYRARLHANEVDVRSLELELFEEQLSHPPPNTSPHKASEAPLKPLSLGELAVSPHVLWANMDAERFGVYRALRGCLLTWLERGSAQEGKPEEAEGVRLEGRCGEASALEVVYASVVAYELHGALSQRGIQLSKTERLTWLGLALAKLREQRSPLGELDGELDEPLHTLPPTPFTLDEALERAEGMSELRELWAQRVATYLFEEAVVGASAEGIDLSVEAQWERVELLAQTLKEPKETLISSLRQGERRPSLSCGWREADEPALPSLFTLEGLPPGPSAFGVALYQSSAGALSLITLPLPARVNEGALYTPSTLSVAPNLQGALEGGEGACVGLYLLDRAEERWLRGALPYTSEGEEAIEEEVGAQGWYMWPLGEDLMRTPH